jgi:hypothetical protein
VVRWMTLEKVPGVSVLRHWLNFVAKALRASPARSCLVLSPQWAMTPFLGDVKPLGMDICCGVDCTGTCSHGTGSPRAWLPGA